jgi:hypothetical protein
VLGSIYLFRTLGKLYINVFFFYPTLRRKKISILQKKSLGKKKFSTTLQEKIKPIVKYKKYLTVLLFFYNLEHLLGVQIFFKFRNVCNPITTFSLKILAKIILFLSNKFSYFKYQFREDMYSKTISILAHIFKFKKPDSFLLANFIASVLPHLYKHTAYLAFLKKLLQALQNVFDFRGVKILLSGKLNGFSRAQSKYIQVGCVTLQSIDFPHMSGISSSFTRAGKIGIKV